MKHLVHHEDCFVFTAIIWEYLHLISLKKTLWYFRGELLDKFLFNNCFYHAYLSSRGGQMNLSTSIRSTPLSTCSVVNNTFLILAIHRLWSWLLDPLFGAHVSDKALSFRVAYPQEKEGNFVSAVRIYRQTINFMCCITQSKIIHPFSNGNLPPLQCTTYTPIVKVSFFPLSQYGNRLLVACLQGPRA